MADNYPKKNDSSKLDNIQKKYLSDILERREIFDEHLKKNDIKLFTCPSCGYPTLAERDGYEICSICDWEDDGQDDTNADEIWGGPNSNLSLTESRLQIGSLLEKLAKNSKGSINLNPGEVLKILNGRDKKIESFRKEKNTMNADINNPVWQEYKQLKKSSLGMLIKKDK